MRIELFPRLAIAGMVLDNLALAAELAIYPLVDVLGARKFALARLGVSMTIQARLNVMNQFLEQFAVGHILNYQMEVVHSLTASFKTLKSWHPLIKRGTANLRNDELLDD